VKNRNLMQVAVSVVNVVEVWVCVDVTVVGITDVDVLVRTRVVSVEDVDVVVVVVVDVVVDVVVAGIVVVEVAVEVLVIVVEAVEVDVVVVGTVTVLVTVTAVLGVTVSVVVTVTVQKRRWTTLGMEFGGRLMSQNSSTPLADAAGAFDFKPPAIWKAPRIMTASATTTTAWPKMRLNGALLIDSHQSTKSARQSFSELNGHGESK
jgi:hypothetical protein